MHLSRFSENFIAAGFALLTIMLVAKSTDILQLPTDLLPDSQMLLAKLRVHQGASATEVRLP